ncbi:MAG: TrkA family potassium uptake protein [Actinomyces sp.]|jgi:trk system potassium uptake protein TrkA|nr:TrkA family potassium uptake protein [Actinomyces sp.]MCI1641043.1 TrkA family potassium uptake protein [Actinomyces sp.]MCI1661411.1 TrkA family potassium uptake protein [Actinomyces sp.]MCI1690419.1 TrkA family potassium uptake protein [Actinomyces sp.]MCI1787060.1 TrkA family potassium uptake protein [Actinomyces sp.]MCI1829374.1 TrkA family potassium uptake protein [Actinomyces sp.]
MKIVIAGAGSVGRFVALRLLAHGHEVTLIDNQPDQLRVASVADADWVLADACSPDVLSDAGVREADALVAATGDDKANLVISLLAKGEFGVPRVVARLNNPKNEWLFDGSWGVDVPVSTPRLMTALVEEAVSVGLPVQLFSFNQADVSMYAFVLPDDSRVVSRRLEDVTLPGRTVLSSILRDGRPITPTPDDVLEAGDELLLLVPDGDTEALGRLTRALGRPQPEAGPEEEPADRP